MNERTMLASGLILATLLACAAHAGPAVSIDVHARQIAPGELLRLEVLSLEPLESAGGEFLGEPVFLVRLDAGDAGERWSGWAMVPLDEDPGVTSFEFRGTTTGGEQVVGTRAITVEPKEFPEENLSVQSKYVEPPKEVQERLARERKKLRGIYARRRPIGPGERPFVRPVPGEPTSIFGTRRLFNGKPRSPHPGLDLRAANGTPVHASGPGEVVLSEELYYSGNIVIVDHGGNLFTLYAHLSELNVAEGDQITAGQQIGLSGSTGRVTGPHLHWGAKIGNRPFDPRALLAPTLFPSKM